MPKLTDYRLARELRDGMPELPVLANTLPDIGDLVEAALEVGAKQRKALPALRRRPRRRRSAGILLLLAVAAGLVIAYRWWNGRGHDPAYLIDAPDASGDSPVATPPSQWTPPTSYPDGREPMAGSEPVASPEEAGRQGVAEHPAPEPVTERTAPASVSTQPRAARAAAQNVRLARGLGRGLSAAMPSLPSVRAAVPGRFSPRLPSR